MYILHIEMRAYSVGLPVVKDACSDECAIEPFRIVLSVLLFRLNFRNCALPKESCNLLVAVIYYDVTAPSETFVPIRQRDNLST